MKRRRELYFKLAARTALSKLDHRKFFMGAVALRNDGTIVTSANVRNTSDKNNVHHAEYRLSSKLDKGAEVYVVRISKKTGGYCMARPCAACQTSLQQHGVYRVYYTISDTEWGVMDLQRRSERTK